MASENETLADIVAEKRTRANEIEGAAGRDANQFQRELICDLRAEADRIEAAAKREKAEAEANALSVGGLVEAARHKPVGNAAAMREALEAALPIMRNCPFTHYNTTEVDAVVSKMKEALSEPARNCDRPECATSKAAQNIWRKEDGGKTPYHEWLLAPVPKEGESDEQK